MTLIFTMNQSMFIVSNKMEKFIYIQRINKSSNFFIDQFPVLSYFSFILFLSLDLDLDDKTLEPFSNQQAFS